MSQLAVKWPRMRSIGGRLRASERDQRAEIVIIRCMKRVDVVAPHVPFALKIGAAPAKTLSAELHDQHVRRETRPATVAVRKRVCRHETMMEPHSDLV